MTPFPERAGHVLDATRRAGWPPGERANGDQHRAAHGADVGSLQFVIGEPRAVRHLDAVCDEVAADHAGVEDDRDVRALVAVGIRHLEAGTAERRDQSGQLDLEPGLLARLADGGLSGGLARFHGAADGSPLLAVDLVDEQQAADVVADVDRDRGEEQQPAADDGPDVGDVAVRALVGGGQPPMM